MRTKVGKIMTKCRKIAEDHYGRKEYFTKKVPSKVRTVFANRVSMLPLAGNFSTHSCPLLLVLPNQILFQTQIKTP